MLKYIDFEPDARKALEDGSAIVALESAGAFDGIPYPENRDTIQTLANRVRELGAIPAHIVIKDGRIKVGLSDEEIEEFAKKQGKLIKASRRDIPMLIAQKKDAIMTIAATMLIADLVGIKVVAGGGIGGVHRGAETSMDISADLEELAVSNVVCVCSGAKSILDLGLTLEYLETKSIPVIGYGTDKLPAYMARESDFNVDYRADDVETIAKAFEAKMALNLEGGLLVTNPIPEQYAVNASEMNRAIEKAVKEAVWDDIKGKAITPYLLKSVKNQMGAESVEAQKHLRLNNAELAAKIAKALP
ncbi:MAG: pseudouridine-5'-phosphate glycosidase [Fibrobacter sp.]|nr:pseudouridine-5'-phosphate glycosidase [Fibrobacter sp.]